MSKAFRRNPSETKQQTTIMEKNMQKLCDCFDALTRTDNEKILMFNPTMGNISIVHYEGTLGFDYKLTIPTEENKTETVLLDEDRLKKLAVACGIGSKHFDVLVLKPEKIIDALMQMFAVSEIDFYLLVGNNDNIVYDVAANTEPIKVGDILTTIRAWYKIGSNDIDPNESKDWTDSELDDALVVHHFKNNDGIITIGFGIKHHGYGGWLRCNRLGSIKTTIHPCYFKQIDGKSIPVIFDIKGITECKPAFKKDVDIATNVDMILGESEDFLYDNKNKLKFEVAQAIDSEAYLKHLQMETKIPKKYVKKGLISGSTIKEIVNSICNECYDLLYNVGELDDEAVKKNYAVFEKLSKAAGYATFYQNRFCDCCFKSRTLAEDEV